MTKRVVLKKGRSGPSIGRHPWVFAGAVASIDPSIEDGDAVQVFAMENERFIGHGLWNSQSEIRIRLYSWTEGESISAAFFSKRIEEAIHLRKDILHLSSSARLIFSEADLLSGLTVDSFNKEVLVAQFTSAALFNFKDSILKTLASLVRPKGIYVKTSIEIPSSESFVDGEPPKETVMEESGLQFSISFTESQKTGFYLDQRENRARLKEFAKDKKVLDLCCYTGAFALQLAAAGAKSVVGVDSSEQSIAVANKNAKLNSLDGKVNFVESDIFDYLKALPADEKFDLIVLDPPRLAPSRKDIERALRMYFSMNEAAMKRLAPGGIFMTCSCSGNISSHDFSSLIQGVGRRIGRDVQILEKRGAAPDHPILAACPETEYLKAFICHVS